jgi:hypothetical protein
MGDYRGLNRRQIEALETNQPKCGPRAGRHNFGDNLQCTRHGCGRFWSQHQVDPQECTGGKRADGRNGGSETKLEQMYVRDKVICELAATGESYEDIGDRFGVTSQRIQQVIKKMEAEKR